MTTSRSNGSIAKITRPRISGAFPRTRLFSLLDGYLNSPAVWISASAGSGKTTLAANYLTEKKLPSIWYQMDEGDVDIATFFYYIGHAAAKATPRKRPLPLLTPEYLQGIEAFTSRYFENLYARLKPPFVIVLDNYQLVSQDSPLHQVICAGIEILPEGINIICISREEPPAQFARLRANGTLRLIDPRELLLTFDDSRSIIAMKGFEELSEKAVLHLHERTEGWAAGLVLMLERVRLSGIDSITSSSITVKEVFDYFAHELFDTIDPEMREFLLKTAFMPKMTVQMAKGLTGMVQSGNLLARLYQRNFFIHRDIQPQPFYQYHPLFREFLQSRVNDLMTQEQVLATRRASANILAEAGQVEDAVGVLLAAQDWESLMPLVLAHAKAFVRQGRSDTIEGWLRAFPKELFDQSPWLLYWTAACRINKAPLESYALFKKAFHLFENQHDLAGTLLAWSGAVNSLLLTWDDYTMLDPWVEWLDACTSQGLAFPSPEIEANVASSMGGALAWRFTYRVDAREWLDRAARLSLDVGDEGLLLQTFFNGTLLNFFLGDLVGLSIITQRMMKMRTMIDASPLSLIYSMTGQALSLALLSMEGKQALQLVKEGLRIAGKSGVHLLDNTLYNIGFYSSLNIKDTAASDEFLQMMEHDMQGGCRDFIGRYYYCSAFKYYLSGDLVHARALTEVGLTIAVEGGGLNNQQFTYHLMAFILQGQKQYNEALSNLLAARALNPGQQKGYYHDYIYCLSEAKIYLDMGLKKKALECLGNAMSIGRKQGYKSDFLFWQPLVLARLCATALENGIEVDYVRGLISALDLPADAVPAYMENWPWPVKIHTLGKFGVHQNGNPVHFPGKAQKKPLQLLIAIISLGGRNVKNERLKDLLWPETEGDKAQSAFTSTLSRLRSLLGNDQAIQVHDGRVSLDPRRCWVDAWAFEQLADMFDSKDHPSTEETGDEGIAEKAIKIYSGAFLAGEDHQPWITPYREQLSKRFCGLVTGIGDRLEKAGRNDEAAKYYRKALDEDEFIDEELYQRLMTYYCRRDQPARAMEVYMRLSRTLAKTLGIKPSLKTEAIRKSLTR